MESSENQVITTGVDKLVDFLKGKGQIEVKEVAKNLGVSTETLQRWVDFLVEEKIISVEYKFTTPFIYILEDEQIQQKKTMNDIKNAFARKAKENKLNETKTEFLWQNQISKVLENKKQFFFKEANKRGINDVEKIWNIYKEKAIQ
ncbi:hypothetical protein K9L67_01985 [Candidatus Woesearchaeota archaeon]|nr:hypothetical protein [Candidatus Woesearchaeota archaeon]MCF7900973.1 hypothetical protein [Candidatus Woesearchaeota archaeon]MCF8013311.1 hypothetical protein [Candidatus Woesearchaeota archaeon]